jgi:hypothetical protein
VAQPGAAGYGAQTRRSTALTLARQDMTNDIIRSGLELAGSTNTQDLMEVFNDGGPLWPYLLRMMWELLLVLAPLLSIVLCIRAWRRHKTGRAAPWALRIILGAALLTTTATIANALEGLSQCYLIAGTTEWGAAQAAMRSINMPDMFLTLQIGCAPIFLCLLCALCLPLKKTAKEDATKEPAAH